MEPTTNKINATATTIAMAPVDWTEFGRRRVMNRRHCSPRCRLRPLSRRGDRRDGQPDSCSRSLPHFEKCIVDPTTLAVQTWRAASESDQVVCATAHKMLPLDLNWYFSNVS